VLDIIRLGGEERHLARAHGIGCNRIYCAAMPVNPSSRPSRYRRRGNDLLIRDGLSSVRSRSDLFRLAAPMEEGNVGMFAGACSCGSLTATRVAARGRYPQLYPRLALVSARFYPVTETAMAPTLASCGVFHGPSGRCL
jgi:hypothetical protein